MKYILLTALIVFSGCAALHDDVTPQEARTMTTSELSYIYGSYRGYAHKLPNIRNELVSRNAL